MNKTRKLIY